MDDQERSGLRAVGDATGTLAALAGVVIRLLVAALRLVWRRTGAKVLPAPQTEAQKQVARETAQQSRRRFLLQAISVGLGGIAAAAVGVPVIRLIAAPLLQQ